MAKDSESHDVVVVVDSHSPQSSPDEIVKEPVKTAEAAVSTSDGSSSVNVKWHRKLNPLRLQKNLPPPPERTQVSREYGASIFSIITFRWMSPLIKVCIVLAFFGSL